ncbi:MAG: metalloregulator ArsR/SmtB family transcription factor [Phyllobacteriaceae bacterium]|nr:metalloregulator ArsR/SmtB family transcription factor [Phyllobacteriaceae bacterium]
MLDIDTMADVLKAIGEPTRLRILALLTKGDLTVSDLTQVLGQSQPRVSRHLKLLGEAALVTRYQEGSWAWFRLTEGGVARFIADAVVARLDVARNGMSRDLERLNAVRSERQARAADYFARNASEWDALRALHVADEAVERALVAVLGNRRIETMLDLGTGTGRLLELFAGHYRTAVGIDMSREMLAIARAKLEAAGITSAAVRQGDVTSPPVEAQRFDLVTVHQVLHYLDEPQAVISEAARALRPEGLLLIVDFAPHALEHLRDNHAHARLGFADEQIAQWCAEAGLQFVKTQACGAPRCIGPAGANGETVGGQRSAVCCWLRQPRLHHALRSG